MTNIASLIGTGHMVCTLLHVNGWTWWSIMVGFQN